MGGAGRRDQLALDAGIHHREAPEELGRARRRHRDPAMRPVHHSAADGERRAMDGVDAEAVQADAGAHDVHDGVHRAHVVELHRVRRDPVHPALGLGQAREDADRIGLHPVRQGAPRDEVADDRERAVRVLGRMRVRMLVRARCHVDFHLGGPEGALHHFPPLQRISGKREAGEVREKILPAEPRVHERPENHVAGGAAGTVEVREAHGLSGPWRRGD
jgi:hypothetical protein